MLARELNTTVMATDISAEALQVARRNCRRHRVESSVHLVQADLGSCFMDKNGFSLVVTNPPYVERGQLENDLEPEVSRYEPHLALDGGRSGLELVERICEQLPGLLRAGLTTIGCCHVKNPLVAPALVIHPDLDDLNAVEICTLRILQCPDKERW